MNSCEPARPPAASQLAMLKLIDAAGGKLYPALYKSLYTGWRHGEKLQSLIALITRRDTFINTQGKTYVSLSIHRLGIATARVALIPGRSILKPLLPGDCWNSINPGKG